MTWILAFAWGGFVGWKAGEDPRWMVGGSVIGGLLLGVVYAARVPPSGDRGWGFLMALTLHAVFAVLAAAVVAFYQLGQ